MKSSLSGLFIATMTCFLLLSCQDDGEQFDFDSVEFNIGEEDDDSNQVQLDSLSFANTGLNMIIGQTARPNLRAHLSNGTTYSFLSNTLDLPVFDEAFTITWISSDTAIATVDADGFITGQSAGTVTITAKISQIQATFMVTVLDTMTDLIVGVSFYQSFTQVSGTALIPLTLVAHYDTGTAIHNLDRENFEWLSGCDLTFSTSADFLATIDDNGVVTPLYEGDVTFTAEVVNCSSTANVLPGLTATFNLSIVGINP